MIKLDLFFVRICYENTFAHKNLLTLSQTQVHHIRPVPRDIDVNPNFNFQKIRDRVKKGDIENDCAFVLRASTDN